MGEKNDTICSYLSDPNVFADFINGSLFGGKQVIGSKELDMIHYTGREKHQDRSGRTRRKSRNRDVSKIRLKNEQYAIIAVENQDELHYFMPFRCMEYDAEDYAKQIRRMRKYHRRKRDLKSGAEFLSGAKETDKLKPVVTIVFYHGKEEWNTCRELYDMIDFSGDNEILKEYTSNYRINLVTLQDMNEEYFKTGLRELIGVMKRRNDKEKMRQFYHDNRERFMNVDDDTYDIIGVMVDRKVFQEEKEANRNGEGGLNMCKAFDELEKEWFQEGEQKFAILVGKLLADGRIEDVHMAIVDMNKRKVFYQEYALEG